jgi:hypothetical protein
MLESKKDLLRRLKISKSDFKKYFLYQEGGFDIQGIAERCGITVQECSLVYDLVNYAFIGKKDIALKRSDAPYRPDSEIASVRIIKGEPVLSFNSLQMARGTYSVDAEKLKKLRSEEGFSKAQERRIGALLKKINLINFRTSAYHSVLQEIVNRQKNFIKTGDFADMAPLTQKEISDNLDLSRSMVSRVIKDKRLGTPRNDSLPLKSFTPSLKEIRLQKIGEILSSGESGGSDLELKRILEKRYGIYIARRTVNKYRNEILGKGHGNHKRAKK